MGFITIGTAKIREINCSRRIQYDGCLIILIVFCYEDMTSVVFTNTFLNAEAYIDILRVYLIPF
jgi:hypothetical protein